MARKMPDMIRFFEGLRLHMKAGIEDELEREAMSDKVCDDLERELIIRRTTILIRCYDLLECDYVEI